MHAIFLFGSSMLAGYRFLKIIHPSIKKQTVHLKVHFPFVSDKRKQAREILCNNNLEWEIECLNETNYENIIILTEYLKIMTAGM